MDLKILEIQFDPLTYLKMKLGSGHMKELMGLHRYPAQEWRNLGFHTRDNEIIQRVFGQFIQTCWGENDGSA